LTFANLSAFCFSRDVSQKKKKKKKEEEEEENAM
jgi:hypothetical protein